MASICAYIVKCKSLLNAYHECTVPHMIDSSIMLREVVTTMALLAELYQEIALERTISLVVY